MASRRQAVLAKEEARVPLLEVLEGQQMSEVAEANWSASGMDRLGVPCEQWTSGASNQALRYSSHGLFRYYGKFPPMIARHLISQHTRPGDTVLDPMIGSGTTAVEAMLLARHCIGADANPLAVLLTRVKCRRVPRDKAQQALDSVMSEAARLHETSLPEPARWPQAVRTEHWFLPDTCHWLQLLRECIDHVESVEERDLLRVVYASIIRKVSRATTEQGRLFLDVDTAEADPRSRFASAAEQAIRIASALPESGFRLELHEARCREHDFGRREFPLIILHPPYFNVYRYSSILSLEAAWLGYDAKAIRGREVREFFKVGKPENVTVYVDDVQKALRNISRNLRRDGTLALMVGDTAIHGKRIETTRLLVDAVKDVLQPTKIAIRTPKFTEASWAASQRRTGEKVGVSMTDFVVHFRRRD